MKNKRQIKTGITTTNEWAKKQFTLNYAPYVMVLKSEGDR